MSDRTVAVIDIGSNSIKTLVARHDVRGQPESILFHTIDARISAGISKARPSLSEQGMATGLRAVRELLALIRPHAPQTIVLVATSAVRDAVNGADFRALIQRETGHDIRILSGQEEANLIGRGLTCDPELADLQHFQVFDLGGGSLECLSFRDRQVTQAVSLQLGCVRLTEKLAGQTGEAIPPSVMDAIADHVRETFAQSPFKLTALPSVATGGTMTTVRAICAARQGLTLEQASTRVSLEAMRAIRDEICRLPLTQRQKIPGLPPARADVFPAAIVTLITLAESARIDTFRHSLHNLRFGLAADLLATP